jgi:hypothetical protein
MRIAATYVSSVGIEAKWMKIQKTLNDEEYKTQIKNSYSKLTAKIK